MCHDSLEQLSFHWLPELSYLMLLLFFLSWHLSAHWYKSKNACSSSSCCHLNVYIVRQMLCVEQPTYGNNSNESVATTEHTLDWEQKISSPHLVFTPAITKTLLPFSDRGTHCSNSDVCSMSLWEIRELNWASRRILFQTSEEWTLVSDILSKICQKGVILITWV